VGAGEYRPEGVGTNQEWLVEPDAGHRLATLSDGPYPADRGRMTHRNMMPQALAGLRVARGAMSTGDLGCRQATWQGVPLSVKLAGRPELPVCDALNPMLCDPPGGIEEL
jgi:hypothetical protein